MTVHNNWKGHMGGSNQGLILWYHPGICLKRLKKLMKHFSQDSRCLSLETSLYTMLYKNISTLLFRGFFFCYHAFHIPYNFITSALTCCGDYDLSPLRENIGNWRINTFFKLDVNAAEETDGRSWYPQRVMTQDLAGTQHTDLSRHKIRTYPPLAALNTQCNAEY
jgi:hypothetical protein